VKGYYAYGYARHLSPSPDGPLELASARSHSRSPHAHAQCSDTRPDWPHARTVPGTQAGSPARLHSRFPGWLRPTPRALAGDPLLSGRQAQTLCPYCRNCNPEVYWVSVRTEPSPRFREQRRHYTAPGRRLGSIRPVVGVVS
jgi:hypothetical protein